MGTITLLGTIITILGRTIHGRTSHGTIATIPGTTTHGTKTDGTTIMEQ